MPEDVRDIRRERLLVEARRAAEQAYAPYSRFRVGAAVMVETETGPRIVTGANVENASYGLALCAERSALAAACALGDARRPDVAEGRVSAPPVITHVAIDCVDAPDDAPINERMPCGACRQWFAELAPEAIFYVAGVADDLTLDDLLPRAFRLGPHAPEERDE
ncbi:MAG TPA: cytidine deaminase [Ktedonobacterales bacterium]|jgi:cytidine deaminase|nr:cytidine deaminase [Ktedonobacterales bacterium]